MTPVATVADPAWATAHHAEINRQLDAIAARRVERQAEHGPEPEYRPTHEDRFEVSRVAELEWLGFELGCGGEAVAGSPEHTAEERAAFLRGHAAGFRAYEEAEFEAADVERERQEWAFADPDDRHHPAEMR